jgi:hypothetical protein
MLNLWGLLKTALKRSGKRVKGQENLDLDVTGSSRSGSPDMAMGPVFCLLSRAGKQLVA